MYHTRHKGTHYEAGYKWGNLLFRHGNIISNQHTFTITEERKSFAKLCIPIYQKYYPEILEEIKGIADGQRDFNGNTTAFVQMEDGINEHGLAIGLTFVYPKIRKAGFNAGMLVRYLLEKCTSTDEVLQKLKNIPVASQQTLTIADENGKIVVVECNAERLKVIYPNENGNFVVTANNFNSDEMKEYRNPPIDDWKSDERYKVAYRTIKENYNNFSFDLAKNILSGKYGFMCQYDRKTDADTVWSVIYELKTKKIFRVEGNPSRKMFKEDKRFKF